eukprot:gene27985-36856_t
MENNVDKFVNAKRKFQLNAFIKSHQKLSALHISKGYISYGDIHQTLRAIGVADIDINAYTDVIEVAVKKKMNSKGQYNLYMHGELVGNDSKFVGCILCYLSSKYATGMECHTIEEFKGEATLYLQQYSQHSVGQISIEYSQQSDARFRASSPESNFLNGKRVYGHENNTATVSKGFYSNSHSNGNNNVGGINNLAGKKNSSRSVSVSVDPGLPDGKPSQRFDYEKSDPIVRLLAQVRKVGMDILFPQGTHDKILACIFVAIMSSKTPAHRELIDMVMAVKDSGKITQLELVSKTKVRGVLALLKHGELLITQGEEGEPVRLYLARGIGSFKDLRERHDIFLHRYISEHKMFIPAVLRSELIWQFDEATKLDRIKVLDTIVAQLQGFYATYTQQTPASKVPISTQAEYRPSSNASPVFDGKTLAGSVGSPNHQGYGDYSQTPYGSDTTQLEQLSSEFSRVGVNSTPSIAQADWRFSPTPQVAAGNVTRHSYEPNLTRSPSSSFRDKAETPQTTVNSSQMFIPFNIPYRSNNSSGHQPPVPIKKVVPTPPNAKYDFFDNNMSGGSNMNSASQSRYTGSQSPSLATGFQYHQHSSQAQAMYEWRESPSQAMYEWHESPSREVKKQSSMFMPPTTGTFPVDNSTAVSMIQRSSPVNDCLNGDSQIWFQPLGGGGQFTRDEPTSKLDFKAFGSTDSYDPTRTNDCDITQRMRDLSGRASPENVMSSIPPRPPLSGGSRSVSSASFTYAHGNSGVKSQEVDFVSRLENNNSFFSENASSLFQKTPGEAFERVIVPRTVSSPFQLPAFGNHSNTTSLTNTPMRPSFDNEDASSRRSTSRSSPFGFQSLAANSLQENNLNLFATRNSTPVMTMQGVGVADVEQASPKQPLQYFDGQYNDSRPPIYMPGHQGSFQQFNQMKPKPQYHHPDQQLLASDSAQFPHMSCHPNDLNSIQFPNVMGALRNSYMDQSSMLDDITTTLLPFDQF